jgi:LuxR family maltose regulon positive regulatory protein
LIARGRKEEAAGLLRDVCAKAEKVRASGLVIGIRVWQALAAPTQAEALAFLTDALIKGEPEGYVRTFADEGRLLLPLLRRALLQGTTPEYTASLISTISAEERRRRGHADPSEGVRSGAMLSARELEIMKLIGAGLSNRQIADRLVVTVGTVKVHVYSIMQKLNARNRTEAVARARGLQLIQEG